MLSITSDHLQKTLDEARNWLIGATRRMPTGRLLEQSVMKACDVWGISPHVLANEIPPQLESAPGLTFGQIGLQRPGYPKLISLG